MRPAQDVDFVLPRDVVSCPTAVIQHRDSGNQSVYSCRCYFLLHIGIITATGDDCHPAIFNFLTAVEVQTGIMTHD